MAGGVINPIKIQSVRIKNVKYLPGSLLRLDKQFDLIKVFKSLFDRQVTESFRTLFDYFVPHETCTYTILCYSEIKHSVDNTIFYMS